MKEHLCIDRVNLKEEEKEKAELPRKKENKKQIKTKNSNNQSGKMSLIN